MRSFANRSFEPELGVTMVPFKQLVYVEDLDTYFPVDEVPEGKRTLDISGTELRDRLARGTEIPAWFSYPDVVGKRAAHPSQRMDIPRHKYQ